MAITKRIIKKSIGVVAWHRIGKKYAGSEFVIAIAVPASRAVLREPLG
jgi:hypothetical protein